MLHSRRRHGDRERGQIIVLFELVLIIILALAALVIDGGALRNNRQILVNTLDSAALAGGSLLPIDGSIAGDAAAADTLIDSTIQANYPGLPTANYTIAYKCLVGVDPATNQAWLSRDIPAACSPTHALGHAPTVSDFTGAGPTRISACDPSAGDKCNVVMITGSATTQYKLAPVVGIPNGSTGIVVSAACNGPCGSSPVVPVDLVIVLDRTGSMAESNGNKTGPKIQSLETAAKAVLGVYDPAKQRVAIAMTGPSEVDAAGNPVQTACSNTAYGAADDGNFFPTTTLSGATTNLDSAATTVNDPKTNLGGPSTQITVAMTTSGSNNTITIPAGGKTGFPPGTGWAILVDNEQMTVTANPTSTTWTVTRTARVAHSIGAPVSTPNYITAATTPITVTSAAGFPTSGNFSIVIDSEQMTVTGGQGTTSWTVLRGQGGTTAAPHSSGETAILAITTASTALPVTTAAGFPTSGNYTIKVDSEQMTVTGGQGTTLWTVTRAQGGTAAATHNNAAAVSWDVDNNDTKIFVDSQSSFPTSFPFTIKVDSEEMSVTAAPSSTSWTVTRGWDSTAIVAHAGGAAVAVMVGKADNNIRIASALGIPTSGTFRIVVDSEQMDATVTGTPSTTVSLNVVRGRDSTAIATHAAGATVKNLTSWVPSAATAGVWVPVGLSGTDTTSPLPNPNGPLGTYEIAGVANPASTAVKAINCISAFSSGTTLAMPIAYAHWYLNTYGRPGVVKGILLETDGHPEDGGGGNNLDALQFTCGAAITQANLAKADGIKIYSVGYGVSANCQSQGTNGSETTTWANKSATSLLQALATGPAAPYYFNAPTGAALADNFRAIAVDLAHSGAHLVQLYPAPVVTGASGSGTVTVSGEYFTGTISVTFGGVGGTGITIPDDNTIHVTAPNRPSGTLVDVVVTTGGGSSAITTLDKYLYP
jgi:hypothetical protein